MVMVVEEETAGTSEGEEVGDRVVDLGGGGGDVLAEPPVRPAGVGAVGVQRDEAVCWVDVAMEVGEPVVHQPVGGREVGGADLEVLESA